MVNDLITAVGAADRRALIEMRVELERMVRWRNGIGGLSATESFHYDDLTRREANLLISIGH